MLAYKRQPTEDRKGTGKIVPLTQTFEIDTSWKGRKDMIQISRGEFLFLLIVFLLVGVAIGALVL